MAASCTMDLYAQNWWDNWNNILDPDFKRSDEEKKVDSYFYQLAKSYSDEIIYHNDVSKSGSRCKRDAQVDGKM